MIADVMDSPGLLAALGVRLVSVDRPGLGASTPAPGRRFGDFADDIRRLAALRGLGRPAMIGNSQGRTIRARVRCGRSHGGTGPRVRSG